MKTWLSNLKQSEKFNSCKKEEKKQTKSVKDPLCVCDSGLVNLNGTKKKKTFKNVIIKYVLQYNGISNGP